jgi:glutamate formiminotransferase
VADAVRSIAGAHLLDRHSDVDHNRGVLTIAGAPAAVVDAAFAAAAVAVARIDLTRHVGLHPRMGAVDVIPMVPLEGAIMADAVTAARGLGARIGAELAVPAWLYGEAAAPGRPVELRAIRGDGFEALREAGGSLRAPDFGPPRLHPTAGGVAVGARPALVAFNVTLDSDDIEVARRLARRVRQSSGGLPAVQALGLRLESQGVAQVTMNLLDHRRSGIAAVLAELMAAAAGEGVALARAELVGLAPAEALAGLDGVDLPGLPTSDDSIEARLAKAGL